MAKERKHYTLDDKSIKYIKKYAEQFGLSESQSLDFMVKEHSEIIKLLDVAGVRKTVKNLIKSRMFLNRFDDEEVKEFDISNDRIDKLRKELDIKCVDVFYTKYDEKVRITDYSKLDFEVQESVTTPGIVYFFVIVEGEYKEVTENVFRQILHMYEQIN